MTEKLWYGADYNPEQWLDRPDILERDVELMKKARVNLVSLGIFSWASLEPSEGEYDFDWLEKTLDRLYVAGIRVDLATPSAARPAWLARKYPEVLRVNADRQRILFSDRENHCYTSPVYREKVRAIDQALARRFGRHPSVVLWHISNEFNGECHCELCQRAFRDWLRARYGDIEAVNRAWNAKFWGHDYADFEQIESPAPHGEHAMLGLLLDWKRFVSHQTVDFLKWERDCVREIVPEAKVCTNLMDRFDGFDQFEMARELDIASWDSYPFWHKPGVSMERTAIKTAMMHDLIYSLKGRPFLLMENTPSFVNWHGVCKGKKPGMNVFTGLQAVAHGADGVLYFQWRQSRGGCEQFHGAVVGHDGREDNRVFVEAAWLGTLLEGLEGVAGTPKEKQAAIVFDYDNLWALQRSMGPRNDGMGLWDEVLRHYAALARIGVGVDFAAPDAELSGYKLVIAPMLFLLREQTAERLRAYAEAGGTLVATYWSGVTDETDLCYLGDAPHGLTGALGVRRTEIVPLYDGETVACKACDAHAACDVRETCEARETCAAGEACAVGETHDASETCDAVGAHSADALVPEAARGEALLEMAALEGATPLMSFTEDYMAGCPAVTAHDCGAGKAYYLASRFEDAFYKRFYAKLCEGLCSPAWPEALPDGALAVRRGPYVFLQNASESAVSFGGIVLDSYGTAIFREKDGKLERML